MHLGSAKLVLLDNIESEPIHFRRRGSRGKSCMIIIFAMSRGRRLNVTVVSYFFHFNRHDTLNQRGKLPSKIKKKGKASRQFASFYMSAALLPDNP